VRWDAPSGVVGWIALEPGHPWPDGVAPYWRRRVHPGWNELIWDDFSGFPPGRPVTLRVIEGQGRWSVAPPDTSALYTPLHLAPLAGLLAALVLAGGAATALAWHARRAVRLAALRPWHVTLAAAALLALGLRAHTLTAQSLWFDEVLTAVGAQSFAWVLYSAAWWQPDFSVGGSSTRRPGCSRRRSSRSPRSMSSCRNSPARTRSWCWP